MSALERYRQNHAAEIEATRKAYDRWNGETNNQDN